MEHIFQVQGMTCGHCERAVVNAVQSVDSNAQVRIDRSQNQVVVISPAERQALALAIREEGYEVSPHP